MLNKLIWISVKLGNLIFENRNTAYNCKNMFFFPEMFEGNDESSSNVESTWSNPLQTNLNPPLSICMYRLKNEIIQFTEEVW